MSANDDQNQSRCADYLDAVNRSVGNNRDTQGIGVTRIGHSSVGYCDEISGEEGKECPEFVITQHELMQLARHYITERLNHDFSWFANQCTGSSEWRRSIYIGRRLDRILDLLGVAKMRALWGEGVSQFRNEHALSDEDWRIFRTGNPEEQEAWRQRHAPDFSREEP